MYRGRVAATIAAASLTLAFLAGPPALAAGPEPEPEPVAGFWDDTDTVVPADQTTDTIIVTFDRDQADPAKAATAVVAAAADEVADADIAMVQPITDRTVAIILDETIDRADADRIGAKAELRAGVRAAEPSTAVAPQTNDTNFAIQWDIRDASRWGVKAETAWQAATGAGVVVGVVDSGMVPHTDLSGSSTSIVGGNVITGYDFVTSTERSGDEDGRDTDPTDPGNYCTSQRKGSSWHGTHVAGTIAAIRNNAKGVAGMAPDAKVQPLRALGRCDGAESDVIAAVLWGAGLPVSGLPVNPTPADVLNLSLGSTSRCSTAMQDAIDAATGAGAVVVVSAGNDSATLASHSPANCRGVIRVTASTHDGQLASYSNHGDSDAPATIAAPGGDAKSTSAQNAWIWSTANSGTTTPAAEAYWGMAGTSMAAPHVSAAAAMLKQLDRSLTPSRIADILTSTADPLPAPCTVIACGAGVVNAASAVRALVPSLPMPPAATPTPKPTATPTPTPTPLTPAQLLARVGTARVSGEMRLGRTVRAVVPNVPAGAVVSYRWLRSGKTISGATRSSRTLTSSDYHKPISVRATVTLAKLTVTRTSATTKVGAGTFSNTRAPYLTGTFKVGRTVTAKSGSWSPKPSKVTYRWLRNGKPISGATHSRYKLKKSDRNQLISVKVTVSKSRYTGRGVVTTSRIVR